MSQKLKPNFTPVPNVIFDEIMRGLNDGEFKTLMAICRYTYGWGKRSDRISLSQLGAITGIRDRSNVHRAIKRLGNLIDVTPGNPAKSLASEYKINVDISDPLLSQQQQTLLSDRQHPVVRPVVSSATIQRKPKKERESDKLTHANLSHSKKRRTRPPDPRVKEFFAWWAGEYETRFHSQYVFRGGKEGALIKALPPDYDTAKLKTLARRFFETDDEWIKGRGGYTIGVFISQLNTLISTSGRNTKPAEVRDLGDGWLEVDGLRISRKDYDRRWKRA